MLNQLNKYITIQLKNKCHNKILLFFPHEFINTAIAEIAISRSMYCD